MEGASGHNWTSNDDPPPGETLASNKGSYVAGGLDAAHDHGLRTGMYASKSKFSLYPTSWDAISGALDVTGADNGQNKVDVYVYHNDTATVVHSFVTNMAVQPFHYAFIHIRDTDSTGHGQGWDITPGSPYSDTVKTVDGYLGSILSLVTTNVTLAGRTAIVLTTDHGGSGFDHSIPTVPVHYTIPFYVWGPGVMAGADLYMLNQATRLNPGAGRPDYSVPVQPIRNGEAANLALKLLGLGPVPGSTINVAQDLKVTVFPLPNCQLTRPGNNPVLSFPTISNLLYDIQGIDSLNVGLWTNLMTNLPGSGLTTNVDMGPFVAPQQFYRLHLHF